MKQISIFLLLILSIQAWPSATTVKQIDTIKNSSGGSSLSVPSTGTTFGTDSNTITLSNKSISGSSNTITNVSLTSGVTGTLPASNGGTGQSSLTLNNVLLGNGTSAVQFVAPGTSGNVLTSDGTTWSSVAPSGSGGGSFYGGILWPLTAACDWNRNSTSFANFTADTDCTTPAGGNLLGNASAPATKVPGITFATLTAGEYLIVANGFFYKGASGDDYAIYRFSDGTVNSTGQTALYASNVVSTGSTISQRIKYATDQTNITIQAQVKNLNGLSTGHVDVTVTDFTIMVYKF